MLSLSGIKDLSQYCRVCLNRPDEDDLLDLDLIYDEDEHINYYDCFTICTNVNINDGERLPHNLCKSCGIELQMVYDFHKKVQDAMHILQQWQEESNISLNKSVSVKCEIDSFLDIVDEEIVQIDASQEIKEDTSDVIPDEIEYTLSNEFEVLNDDLPIGEPEKSIVDCQEHLDFEIFPKEIKEDGTDNDSISEKETNNKLENILESLNIEIHTESISSGHSDPDQSNFEEYTLSISGVNAEDLNYDSNMDEDIVSSITDEQLSESNCNISGKKVKSKSSSYKKKDGPPYLCEVCGHSSPTRNLLASHRHRKHRTTPFKFSCQKCGKGFDTSYRLERHLQRPVCETYPEFVCEYCSKICIGIANFKVHMRFHEKQYPYECQLCEKKFMMAAHLNTHVQSKHENQRYLCAYPDCGKLFQTKGSLKTHLKMHSPTLPYKCKFCILMHPTKSRLRFHIKRSHKLHLTSEELDEMLVEQPETNYQFNVQSVLFDTLNDEDDPGIQ